MKAMIRISPPRLGHRRFPTRLFLGLGEDKSSETRHDFAAFLLCHNTPNNLALRATRPGIRLLTELELVRRRRIWIVNRNSDLT
jgi:hypothetical protein